MKILNNLNLVFISISFDIAQLEMITVQMFGNICILDFVYILFLK
jgi:hypothetical protein